MPAREDDGQSFPQDIARKVLTPQVVRRLYDKFELKVDRRKTPVDLLQAGRLYVDLSRPDLDDDFRVEKQRFIKRALAHQKRVRAFIKDLNDMEDKEDTIYGMYRSARRLREPPPSTPFPHLTDHQKLRGEPYYFELLRLLHLLDHSLSEDIRRARPRRGPKRNEALEAAIGTLVGFWVYEAKEKFTLDYHQGTGTTKAFHFCKTFIGLFDDVPDTKIITVMRAEISMLDTGKNLEDLAREILTADIDDPA